jgi:6-pyruvoyltetrahydropterin/6-carboxytetrahydropterin synthase
MYSITKTMRTETAHRLMLHRGLCQNIHGHSYKWEVTVTANQLNLDGMVVDFAVLKNAMEQTIGRLDHALVLNKNDVDIINAFRNIPKVVLMEYEPTAETMCYAVAKQLNPYLPTNVWVKRVKLWETGTSFAVWCENGKV